MFYQTWPHLNHVTKHRTILSSGVKGIKEVVVSQLMSLLANPDCQVNVQNMYQLANYIHSLNIYLSTYALVGKLRLESRL